MKEALLKDAVNQIIGKSCRENIITNAALGT